MAMSALFSFLHFAAVFGVVGTLVAEWVILNPTPTYREATRLQQCDRWYGISATVLLIVGFLRVFYFEKGSAFYFANYEGMRQTQQPSQNLVIPANADFYSGVFRYVGTDGVLRSANLMSLTGLTIDPKLRSEFLSLLPDPGCR